MEYIKVEKDIWKMQDGTLFEGNINDVPKGNPSSVAKAGKEYSKEYLEFHGWGKKEEVKKSSKKKSASKKTIEDKAVKPEDVEDK
jgi:hypothetical protein